MSFLTPLMTSSVEAEPAFRIVISTAFLPSTRTMLSCGGLPRWTKATSRMNTTVPSAVLIGSSLSFSTSVGASLRFTIYSNRPIFSVPTGVIWFWLASAATTSEAVTL